ncbi:hypothetical protein OAT33_00035 [Methylophilaceae bacterium]|nr:hypothetical protein [Methylophilaceae bacterium]
MRLNVYYDLKYAPATFDFGSYLVLCNAVRQSMGAESMGVTIVADQFREWSIREKNTPKREMKFRVAHILSRLPFLIPEVDSLNITYAPLTNVQFPSFPGGYPGHPDDTKQIPYQHEHLHSFYGKEGINLKPYKSSEQARYFVDKIFGDDVITISLRTSYFQAERNSNLDEWYKVYQELKRLKFRPIVIPDFDDCMKDRIFTKYDWEVFEPAAYEIDLRLALQEKAINNLAINHGSGLPMEHSDCPFYMFKWHTESLQTTSAAGHKVNFLMDYGDSKKWAAPNQHHIWETDDADIILKTLKDNGDI